MPQAGSRVRPGLWGAFFILLTAAGAICSLLAAVKGIGVSSRLNDAIPWGIFLGLDIFCGVALATGALWIALFALITGINSWQSVRTAGSCIALAGYTVAILGGIAELGAGEKAWPALIQFWSQASVVFGGVWTVALLALVLAMEFLPGSPRLTSTRAWTRVARQVHLLLVATAAVLATMHQVGLTRTISLSGQNFWPLWSGPGLGLEFFLSSVCAALSALLFASWRSLIAFGKRLPSAIASGIGRLLAIAVFLYLALRVNDLAQRGVEQFVFSRETAFLALELGMFFIGMTIVSAGETAPKRLYHGSALIMAGVVANRLNTSITALERNADRFYRPHWIEFIIAYSLVAVGVFIFAVCVKHLPVFVNATEGS